MSHDLAVEGSNRVTILSRALAALASAVARRKDGSGFLITAYPTDVIKVGEMIWTRSR